MSGAADNLDPQVDLAALPDRIHGALGRHVRERPDATALIDHDGSRVSFRALDSDIESATYMLAAAGAGPGERVLIVNENCVAAAVLLFACSRLDAWAVMVNARLAAPEIDRILAHAEPKLALFTSAVSPQAAEHGRRHAARPASRLGVSIAGPWPQRAEPTARSGAEQVAEMLYTSGTTGSPKGVMITHRNALFIATVSGALRGMSAADRVYAVLPLAHIFGLNSTFLGAVVAGAEIRLVPRFDPAHLAAALSDGITVFQGVPAMYAKLLEHLESTGQHLHAPGLRYMSAGGAPLDIGWKRRIERRFGLTLNNGYGLSEASPTVSQTRIADPRDDDSVGPPLPGTEVRFVDAAGHELADGEVGECQLRGPNVMKGYFRNEAATRAVITADGWLKTGDLGYRDAKGNLFLVGRLKELIIRSGFNVYPPEVEAALNTHPSIVQSAVIGRKVEGNEEVVAFIEVKPGHGLDAVEVARHARERLAPYKCPTHIFIRERLPAGPTGKILKAELAALAEPLIARAASSS